MDEWLQQHLVCPRDHLPLAFDGSSLDCAKGHVYPVIDGVPVMLLDDVHQTLGVAQDSLRLVAARPKDDPWFIDSLGCSAEEKKAIRELIATRDAGCVDPVVQFMVAATNGILYAPLLGRLRTVPIPELRLPAGSGQTLLDIGCNWGRWSIAAAQKGYDVVGIDPSLGAIMAAKRVSSALGVAARYVVADARFLPFAAGSFGAVFSYSVLQHFSKADAVTALQEVARVLKEGGSSLIQMPNALGIRSLQHQLRRGFRSAEGFDVRYWTPRELTKTFQRVIGETKLSVDGYFGLGVQTSDAAMLPFKYRAVVQTSEFLRAVSRRVPFMSWFADSVYLHSKTS
jgi:2-polyprenyl-3-methyl-5-hydroxy-6-metoxy-1,4-benzoquinol methylase/uncharacterized protein YbaR (Trm112 family)